MIKDAEGNVFAVETGDGMALFAARSFRVGEIVDAMNGSATRQRTRTSIQIGCDDKGPIHVEDDFGRFTNHNGRRPTVCVDGRNLVAIRWIHKDRQITFDYGQNERDADGEVEIAAPFIDSQTDRPVGDLLAEDPSLELSIVPACFDTAGYAPA